MRKIITILTVLLVLSFSSLAFASGNWSVTILPNMPKELTPAEADKALQNYKGGLLVVQSTYFQQRALEAHGFSGDNDLGILSQYATDTDARAAVSDDKILGYWRTNNHAIAFAYCNKMAQLLARKENGESFLRPQFGQMLDSYMQEPKVTSAQGKLLFLDTLSPVTDKAFLNMLSNGDGNLLTEFRDRVSEIAATAVVKNMDVVVVMDPIYSKAGAYITDDKKHAVIILPVIYGQANSQGANVTSKNGIISVQMFDTSSI